VLFTGYFAVFGSHIEALISQMLLQESEVVSGIVLFHRINGEAIAQRYRFYSFGDAMLIL